MRFAAQIRVRIEVRAPWCIRENYLAVSIIITIAGIGAYSASRLDAKLMADFARVGELRTVQAARDRTESFVPVSPGTR